MPHPQFFTLNLLRNLITTAPVTFPQARREEMLKKVEDYTNDVGAPLEQIEETMLHYGQEIWPYRESYTRLYEQYGRKPEEEKIASFLNAELKEKYHKFLADRGNIENLRSTSGLEIYFAPEEQAAVVEAELKAHDAVHRLVEKMIIGEKRDEYEVLLAQYKTDIRQIEEKLRELEKIEERAPAFAEEIAEKVLKFEQGFSHLDHPVALADVQSEVDYYFGVAGLET